eukprot:766154-Hanusia_phi.AAC.6
MGKWAGTQYTAQQTKTLPYGMEYGQIFQHNAGNGDTARYQVSLPFPPPPPPPPSPPPNSSSSSHSSSPLSPARSSSC